LNRALLYVPAAQNLAVFAIFLLNPQNVNYPAFFGKAIEYLHHWKKDFCFEKNHKN
jgi:hypothetical protein